MRCARCGGDDFASVMSAESPGPVGEFCVTCGSAQPGRAEFRRWRGEPVYMVHPDWTPGDARMLTADLPARCAPTLVVWCGPPAPHPLVPTPEQLLHAALGLLA